MPKALNLRDPYGGGVVQGGRVLGSLGEPLQKKQRGRKRKTEDRKAEGQEEEEAQEEEAPWRLKIQGRAPKNHLLHKKVCPVDALQPGDLDLYKTWTTRSYVDGGRHSTILSNSTVSKHIQAYRTFVQHLLDEGLVTPPVTFLEALTKINFKAYIIHLQNNNNSRGGKTHPATMRTLYTSMGVMAKLCIGP